MKMETNQYLDEFQAIQDVLEIFKKINPEDRTRILKTVGTFLNVNYHRPPEVPQEIAYGENNERRNGTHSFSEDRSMSAKEFLLQKKPATDAERVACLAFYLTHYCNTPYFKTLEISKLNMDAAQIKFSDVAAAMNNATKGGLLVPASKGQKQISAMGEMFVQALPDRDAAKEILKASKSRKRSKTNYNLYDKKENEK